MRRKYALIFTGICILGFILAFLFKETSGPTKELDPIEDKIPKTSAIVTPEQSADLRVQVTPPALPPRKDGTALSYSLVKNVNRVVANDSYEYIELPSLKLSLVKNYQAVISAEKSNRDSPIAGFDLLDSQSPENFNLVFNKVKQKYGVWSREIILSGSESALIQIQQQFGLSKLSEAYYLVPEDISLERVYSASAEIKDLTLQLDVAYSRIRSQ